MITSHIKGAENPQELGSGRRGQERSAILKYRWRYGGEEECIWKNAPELYKRMDQKSRLQDLVTQPWVSCLTIQFIYPTEWREYTACLFYKASLQVK